MNQLTERGGARIGRVNSSWPLGTLDVTSDRIILNATIIGKYVFRPEDVTAIEVFGFFPKKGIRIHHRIAKYSNKVIFWSPGDPAALIRQIRHIGFMDGIVPITDEDIAMIRNRKFMDGVPVRTSVIIAVGLIWNLMLLLGHFLYPYKEDEVHLPVQHGVPFATGFVVVFCLLTLTLKPFQQLLLKKGRTFDEIRPFFWFISGICSVIFLAFLAANSAGLKP